MSMRRPTTPPIAAFNPPPPKAERPSMISRVHEFTHAADTLVANWGAPLRPYLPPLGRLLVVLTFFEDTIRILTGWSTQMAYLNRDRRIPRFLALIFLLSNVCLMLFGASAVVAKKQLKYAVSALLVVIFSQAVAYGLVFDQQFFARNISLIGGLVLVLSEIYQNDRSKVFFAGPIAQDKDRKQDMLLVGRLLLIVLFVSHLLRTNLSVYSTIISVLNAACCVLVVIGYKARISAVVLATLLVAQNTLTNPYWKFNSWNPLRDQMRYEHFQFLAVVGGLILLANIGAGRLSFDEKRKIY